MANKIKQAAFLAALEKSLGVVTTASKKTGISRTTHKTWMAEDAEYRRQVRDLKDVSLDFGESCLHSQMKNGNASSTIFFLKTQGKERGYVERFQHEIVDEFKEKFKEKTPDEIKLELLDIARKMTSVIE